MANTSFADKAVVRYRAVSRLMAAVRLAAGDTDGGQIFIPGFGWVENEGGGSSGTVAQDMYENGNKIGVMD